MYIYIYICNMNNIPYLVKRQVLFTCFSVDVLQRSLSSEFYISM